MAGAGDFTHLISKEMFLKSILACALESVFYITIVKGLQIFDILSIIDLKPFDYWRLLSSFLKFDP